MVQHVYLSDAGEATSALQSADGLGSFLEASGISAATTRLLTRATSLRECAALLKADRPAFLRRLRELGVQRLAERQAGAPSKASPLGPHT